jgi:hypothetical protein
MGAPPVLKQVGLSREYPQSGPTKKPEIIANFATAAQRSGLLSTQRVSAVLPKVN